jgi:ubiquinone/menaquinone biosynthesis C-methylase UbiE
VPAIFGPWARVLIDLASPKPGMHALDAACGTGAVARMMAPAVGSTGRVVGLDFDPAMIAVARELAPDIEWQQGDLQSLPFADESFDVAICQQGLQFLPDRPAGLRQLHRVLRPAGRLVLGIWSDLAKSPGQARLFEALGAVLNKDMSSPPAWSLTDAAEIRTLVASAGFADIEMTQRTLHAPYRSARRFVEIMIGGGTSKLTRQALDQIPTERRAALIAEVADRLREFETGGACALPNESHLVVARKAP